MQLTENQNKAIDEIIEMVVSVIGNGSREIDTADAISTTARLAGSFLFRSFGFKINDAKPGTVLLSEQANTKGIQLINITYAALQNFGIRIDDNKMNNGNQKQPTNSFIDVIKKVQRPAREIMKKNDLNYEQMAQSAAIATAFIIQQSTNITPEESLGTAIYSYIEGTKTFPPDFSGESEKAAIAETARSVKANSKSISKPWWKFWN